MKKDDLFLYDELIRAFCAKVLGATHSNCISDAMQDTYASALESLKRDAMVGDPNAWLAPIARNASQNILRALNMQRLLEQFAAIEVESDEYGHGDISDGGWFSVVLSEGLQVQELLGYLSNNLTTRQQQLLDYVLLGHSQQQIVNWLGFDRKILKTELEHIQNELAEWDPGNVPSLVTLFQDSVPAPEIEVLTQKITAELIAYLARHPHALYEVRPRQFEHLVAELLSSYGWEVNLTPATRDGGYDLFAFSKDSAGVRTSWIIECKKYGKDHRVGIDVVRDLYGARDLGVSAGMMMLATTSHFTSGVHALKASRYDLELKDFEGVLEWLNEYRPSPTGRLYVKNNRLNVVKED